jgi:uncharacterized membrane protein
MIENKLQRVNSNNKKMDHEQKEYVSIYTILLLHLAFVCQFGPELLQGVYVDVVAVIILSDFIFFVFSILLYYSLKSTSYISLLYILIMIPTGWFSLSTHWIIHYERYYFYFHKIPLSILLIGFLITLYRSKRV